MKIGIAGIGFMGWIHWLAYDRCPESEVVAIASRDPKKRAGDWTMIEGNFPPPGEQVDLSNVNCHETYDQLLADPAVEVVDICLPPSMHCDAAIQALEADKHVFVEKPMALTPDECDRMVAAANAAGKQVLVGHVLPFFPEYTHAIEAARQRTYGKVLGGSFKRIISDPTWISDFYDPQKVGGPLVDLHVHDAHLICVLFGMPSGVVSQGRFRGEVVEFCHSLFDFDGKDYVVHAVSGVINQQGRPFTHGFELQFEKATLQYEFAVAGGDVVTLMPLTVYDESGEVRQIELESGDSVTAFVHEVEEVAQAIHAGNPSQLLGGALARDAIVLCQRQTEAVRNGSRVEI